MKRIAPLFVAVILLLGVVSCDKKQPAPAADAPVVKEAAGAAGSLAAKLKPTAVKPDVPADQSSPIATVQAFFQALDVVLNKDYQAANRDPSQGADKAAAYVEAMSRVRQIFASSEHFQNVAAYLEVIHLKSVTIDDEAKIDGDKAKLGVVLFKGDNLRIDPMFFGETSQTEARINVDLVKTGDTWRIVNFGGLAAAGT